MLSGAPLFSGNVSATIQQLDPALVPFPTDCCHLHCHNHVLHEQLNNNNVLVKAALVG